MSKGLFISFEGGEGSGKTTILSHIVEKLQTKDINHIITREPGGCAIAEQIRDIVLDVENTNLNKRSEALLYAASRAQHVEEVLKPALTSDKLVICDRYVDSSIVYQGYARKQNIEDVWSINNFAMDGVMPDISIFFDIKPVDAFKRMAEHSRELDRLDLEDIEFHNVVYDGFLELSKQERFVKVDATKSIDEVVDEVYEVIYNELVKRGMCE